MREDPPGTMFYVQSAPQQIIPQDYCYSVYCFFLTFTPRLLHSIDQSRFIFLSALLTELDSCQLPKRGFYCDQYLKWFTFLVIVLRHYYEGLIHLDKIGILGISLLLYLAFVSSLYLYCALAACLLCSFLSNRSAFERWTRKNEKKS
jgi:hypothetical protein